MDKDIYNFIKSRFSKDCDWCNGNCFWFAFILHTRFPKLSIWLFPIENHFMAGDGKRFYDWNGVRELANCDEEPIQWETVKNIDPLYYNRLIRDCIL